MPWMLLDGSRERVRAVRNGAHRREPARHADAWVLLGNLDAALYQAGIIDTVIERISRPHVIFAGGASVLDAVLALDGAALTFRIGWERMRAAHVLGAAALERAPLARLTRGRGRNGDSPGNGSPVPFDLLRAVPDGHPPALRLLRSGAFIAAHGESEAAVGELVASSLREAPGASELATAIDESVVLGAGRILVLGADETALRSHEVARATDHARASAVEVIALPLASGDRPGTLGYVLPGLGRTDRLIERGRRAARRWLAEAAVSTGV